MTSEPWTALHWTQVSTASLHVPIDFQQNRWSIGAWTGGWLAFYVPDFTVTSSRGSSFTVQTFNSTDGLHWQPGGGFKATGPNGSGVGWVEGSAGVLAYSSVELICSAVARDEEPIAISRDGKTWAAIDPTQFGTAGFQEMSGGSAGYTATGTGGTWTSADGLAWHKASLKGQAFAGLDGINDGAAVGGGFVMSGETYGPVSEGCGSGPTPLSPTVWWSADGTSWSRQLLPGVKPGLKDAVMLCRLAEDLVVASDSTAAWVSHDGRTWTVIPDARAVTGDDVTMYDGQALVIPRGYDKLVATVLRRDLSSSELLETGTVPDPEHLYETHVGPTGALAFDDLGFVYVGVPVSN